MSERERPWNPMPPHAVASLFRTYPARWWIAGGWSLDLFLGHPTRLHDDTDILVLREDLHHIHATLPDWIIHASDPPGTLRPWHAGEELPDVVHDIWCRPAHSERWSFQFMVMDTEADRWLFRRDHRISGMLADLSDVRDGIPILAPEIQLLYKARTPNRPKDQADLRWVIPRLSSRRRAWLRDALEIVDPENSVLHDLLHPDRVYTMRKAF